MKVVKVSVKPVREGEIISGTFTTQAKKGEAWTNEDVVTFLSSDPGSEREFPLRDDQRLVVDGKVDTKVVYDIAQRASVTVKAEPETAAPVDTEGDESPPKPAVERAMEPSAISDLQAQERRDAAITAARDKVKEGSKPGEHVSSGVSHAPASGRK